MFANFLAQDATFLHQKENVTGTLVSRLNTDTEVFGAVLTLELQEMMKPFFQTVLGIFILFVIDWQLSLVFSCLLVFLNACMIARSVLISAARVCSFAFVVAFLLFSSFVPLCTVAFCCSS